MKKILTIASILSLAILIPAHTPAQSKKDKKQAGVQTKVVTPPAPELRDKTDSLTYAFGHAIIDGLPQYLVQTGILADTSAIRQEYTGRIESDPVSAATLEAEMTAKIDSAKAVNETRLNQFIAGFKQAFLGEDNDPAFNSGIAIAGQINGMVTNFSGDILEEGEQMNRELFASVFASALRNEKPLIENARELFQQKAQEAQTARQKAEYAGRIKDEEAFMAENKTKPGVITLPSGLQYEIITEGHGAIPRMNDNVKVHYHGTLQDGTVFDSSVERGEPIGFRVGQLIEGWNEALLLMPAGSKWKLFIPYNLAYGSRDMGQIPPFSNLIFEVELLSVGEDADNQ